jgi:hypothetical protein
MGSLARQRSAVAAIWAADARSRPAGDSTVLGDLRLHTTGIALAPWNGACVTGPDTPWYDASSWFGDRGMPWGVLVPSELDVVPPSEHVTDQPVMLRDLSDLGGLPELDLRWEAGDDAAAVQAGAFETDLGVTREFVLPKLVNDACAVVTAYDGGVPVATATLVVADGVAGVYGVGTALHARRQGWGRAVTLAVLHEGRRRDCDLAFLNPSQLGYGTYARLGFVDAPPWRIYAAT